MSDSSTSSALEEAVALHRAGQLDRAAEAYRRILEQSPDDPNVLHLLGVTHVQRGEPDRAVELIERAIALRANVGVYHLNLAAAYRSMARIDDAIANAEKAIALDPAGCAARGYQVAGMAFGDAGQFEDAAYCFEKSIEVEPAMIDSHLLLGVSLERVGRWEQAKRAYEQALRLAQEHVAREPNSGAARATLARVRERTGELESAAEAFETATRLLPDDPTLHYALGQVLQSQGKLVEALACFTEALRLNPRYADALIASGAISDRQHRPREAIEAFRSAAALKPLSGQARGFLAAALTHAGEIEQALAAAREAVRLSPASESIHATLLLTMHYSSSVTPQELFDEHLAWSKRHAEPLRAAIQPHPNARDPEKRLRVGFLSGDFKKHPVAKVILPVLEHRDRERFELLCYSSTEVPDELTESIRQAADGWRHVVSFSDETLAQQIRHDQVDVLVDLSGHTGRGRLLTLARKPAPVQVTHFGYPNTTGLATVDYRITDSLSDPPGMTEQWHVEELARLPRVAWCYRPVEPQPPIARRDPSQPVLFGSVNNVAKLSEATLATWAKLLEASPHARLLVLATSGDVELTTQILVRHGLDASRLVVVGRTTTQNYLDLFNRFDVALDPFPYNGGVTTCDALWMGVPVVALAGQTYFARQGLSILTNVGLPDLVAQTPEQYVQIAAVLASDRQRLSHLRQNLRSMMLASPLCDYAGYTAELQTFFRQAWREWCRP